jgi:hypothetical protein
MVAESSRAPENVSVDENENVSVDENENVSVKEKSWDDGVHLPSSHNQQAGHGQL